MFYRLQGSRAPAMRCKRSLSSIIHKYSIDMLINQEYILHKEYAQSL